MLMFSSSVLSRLVLAISFLLTAVTTASSQEQPCVFPRRDQVIAHVRAVAYQSLTGSTYYYFLENEVSARQSLVSFAVQGFADDERSPVQTSPTNWEAGGRISRSAFFVWDTFVEPRGLAPGESAVGFGFSQASLPAIVGFLAWGDVEPPTFPEGEAPSSCENTNILENGFKGSTIGPKPPASFVPLDFLDFLINVVDRSRQLGWIKVKGVHLSLLVKLGDVKRMLEANQEGVAKNILNAFLNEVRATSCPRLSCPGNKPLTSEAYALLFFNGRFLLERLP